jgi:hypothetical protein
MRHNEHNITLTEVCKYTRRGKKGIHKRQWEYIEEKGECTDLRLIAKRMDKAIRVFFWVSGLKYSGIGMAKMTRSRTDVVIAWPTKNPMNSNKSLEPSPQHRLSGIAQFQYAATGQQGTKVSTAKTTPQSIDTTIIVLHMILYLESGSKVRRYWKSSASLINVTDKGYETLPMYMICKDVLAS